MQNNISFVNTIFFFFFGIVTVLQMQKGFLVILDQGCALSSCLFVAFFFFLALCLTGSAEFRTKWETVMEGAFTLQSASECV